MSSSSSSSSTFVGVRLTAPVFSSLLYEHASSRGDQEGFLLGEVKTRHVDVISDSQINDEKEEVALDVTAVLPCTTDHQFYNNCGEIAENVLKNMLKNDFTRIVGWYRFRRNTHLEPLAVERVLHRKLATVVPLAQNLFVFAVFTACTSTNASTHSFDHVFLRFTNRQFENVPVSVVNLGNTSQLEYKTHSHAVVDAYLRRFGVLQKTSNANDSLMSIGTIQEIQHVLKGNLQGLHRQVRDTEESVHRSLQEITELRKKLKEKQDISQEGTKSEVLAKPIQPVRLPMPVTAPVPQIQECAVDLITSTQPWNVREPTVNLRDTEKSVGADER